MIIDRSPFWFSQEGIEKIQRQYGAVHMGYWCTKKPNGSWNESPVDVFYQPNPDVSKGHSHYFGVFIQQNQVYITDAASAFSEPMMGVLCEDGEVLVSRYRNDCVMKNDAMVDGGRDYLRYTCNEGKLMNVKAVADSFEITQA